MARSVSVFQSRYVGSTFHEFLKISFQACHENTVSLFRKYTIPFLLVHNKSDRTPLSPRLKEELEKEYRTAVIDFSALQQEQPENIIQAIKALMPSSQPKTLLEASRVFAVLFSPKFPLSSIPAVSIKTTGAYPGIIEDLILYFTQEICTEMRITPKQFTPEAIERMKNYEWSGNIRELRNVVERLIILCNNVILPEDVELYK